MTTPSYGPPSSSSRASPCRRPPLGARAARRELLEPRQRVEQVAREELAAPARTGAAHAPVLVAPVLAALRRARKVEVEVGRQPRRAGGARKHDAQHVCVRVALEQAIGSGGARPRPRARTSRGRIPSAAARERPSRPCASRSSSSSVARSYGRVFTRISSALNAATSTPDGVVARLERLHERRSRAREGIEHTAARRNVPLEQRLDELWDELAEIRDGADGRASSARAPAAPAPTRRARGRCPGRAPPASPPRGDLRRDGRGSYARSRPRASSCSCELTTRARRTGPGGRSSSSGSRSPRQLAEPADALLHRRMRREERRDAARLSGFAM